MNEVYNTSSASHAPEEVRKFAKLMSERQGCRVVIAREVSGYHVYIPCPACLEEHGRKELADPKYAINVSKHLALGDDFKDLRHEGQTFDPIALERRMRSRETRDDKSGICMRTRQSKAPHRFNVRDLLDMRTITERHPDIFARSEVVGHAGSADREQNWEVDPVSGVLCPPPPGVVVPITELPTSHPAVQYLLARGYDLQRLYQQFRCSYCVEEYPEGKNGIFYRKMPGGWKDTPQGRIIFYSLVKGVPMTWQARYPEKVSADGRERYMLHPYWEQATRTVYTSDIPVGYSMWSHTHTRPSTGHAWIPVPPFDELSQDGTLKFQPSKYRTAKYSSRQMMGWDAAIDRANKDPDFVKWVVLCEGPLDAARVGPGGVALIGSSISADNASLVASNFHIVFTAFDEDKAGRGATEKVGKMLMSGNHRSSIIQLVIPLQISGGKDLGDMSQEAFDALFRKARNKASRGL